MGQGCLATSEERTSWRGSSDRRDTSAQQQWLAGLSGSRGWCGARLTHCHCEEPSCALQDRVTGCGDSHLRPSISVSSAAGGSTHAPPSALQNIKLVHSHREWWRWQGVWWSSDHIMRVPKGVGVVALAGSCASFVTSHAATLAWARVGGERKLRVVVACAGAPRQPVWGQWSRAQTGPFEGGTPGGSAPASPRCSDRDLVKTRDQALQLPTADGKRSRLPPRRPLHRQREGDRSREGKVFPGMGPAATMGPGQCRTTDGTAAARGLGPVPGSSASGLARCVAAALPTASHQLLPRSRLVHACMPVLRVAAGGLAGQRLVRSEACVDRRTRATPDYTPMCARPTPTAAHNSRGPSTAERGGAW